MTQTEFGAALQLGGDKENFQSAISHLENGSTKPSMELFERIVELGDYRVEECISLPEIRERNAKLHRWLDLLLNDEAFERDVKRYLTAAFNDMEPPAESKEQVGNIAANEKGRTAEVQGKRRASSKLQTG
jgi:hypothetical protein